MTGTDTLLGPVSDILNIIHGEDEWIIIDSKPVFFSYIGYVYHRRYTVSLVDDDRGIHGYLYINSHDLEEWVYSNDNLERR